MARRRHKKRTHQPPDHAAHGPGRPGTSNRPPKSMVIRMGAGEVGSSVSQLVKDFRTVMEPHTASRLKERRGNKLKDYTSMAGPLGVTHLFLFSRSPSGNINMRIGLTPRGPTLHFRVEKYSLSKDVAKSQRHPRGSGGGGGREYMTPPLLVMNNFTSRPSETDASTQAPPPAPIRKQLESLATTVFQSIFPPISPQTMPLSSVKRVLLLNRELQSSPQRQNPTSSSEKEIDSTASSSSSSPYILDLRHYAITTRQTGVSKRIRRLDAKEQQRRQHSSGGKSQPGSGAALPNLGNLQDMSDYLLDPSGAGFTSASETELDTDAEIEVLEAPVRKVLSRKDREKLRAAASSTSSNRAESNSQKRDSRGVDSGANGGGKGGDAPEMTLFPPTQQQPNSDPSHPSAAPVSAGPHALSQQQHVQRLAVKLLELGPRMRLRLVKIEEGLCEGRTMWNEFVHKSHEEEKVLEERWATRRREREERRKVQRENVEKKRTLKDETRRNTRINAGGGGEEAEGDGDMDEDADDFEEDYEDYEDSDDVDMEEDVADDRDHDVDEDR